MLGCVEVLTLPVAETNLLKIVLYNMKRHNPLFVFASLQDNNVAYLIQINLTAGQL